MGCYVLKKDMYMMDNNDDFWKNSSAKFKDFTYLVTLFFG